MPKPPIAETNNCYAVCVGINQYCSSAQVRDLHCAEKDAEALYDLLLRKGFAKDNCLLILGTEATQETVYDALKTFVLTKPRSDDLIIFYFAGHGLPISISNDEEDADLQSDVFLVTSNFDHQRIEGERGAWLEYPLRLENLRTDFFERTRSKKVLFILDSCHSGDIYGPSYRGEQLAHHYIEQAFAKKSAGRVVLSSCMPQQKAREDKKLGHGLFTYHLLEALEGRTPHAVERDGWLTVGSLFSYLSKKLPIDQRPVKSGVEHSNFQLLYYPEYVERSMFSANQGERDEQKDSDKEHRLRAMLADHLGFMRDRLESFVGRQAELIEIRQRIAEKLLTGGYVTITGQAGQGKSCIIAKLVEEYGPDNVSFHFIPFNPGPDHQVGLLRNLMARLILKYNLPEIYVASESRPALRDYFPKVLGELVAKGGQEVIFVDGLDQLEEELSGFRDLSFLPNNPPPGVVFVLGTRPNDTLKPLELLKPRHEYKLPDLSRNDFDLLLERRNVHLSRELANRFYEAMQKNALYLDLVAKELAEAGAVNEVEVIKRIADNPDNIFSLSIERFKRQERQWRTILKPILGLLLAANEPLGVRHIRQVLAVEDDELRDGLRRLGGLVAEDGQGRRYLFHLKLQEYLRQDENKPDKEFVFASDEEIWWHKKLISWCEQNGLENIWQDVKWDADEQGRRVYARQHYVTHLYQSREWDRLWNLLDEGNYGRMKVRFDPSTRSYAQDLDIGRQASAWKEWSFEEGVNLLPYLWRYTLLRCSLTSRADQYTPEAFEALMLLKRVQQAVDLAELLTNPAYKVAILRQIARHLRQQLGREHEGLQLLMRAYEVVQSIEEDRIKTKALRELSIELTKARRRELIRYMS